MEKLAQALSERRSQLRDPPVRQPGRKYDYLGRKVPSKLDAVSFARGLPGYAERFDRTVPSGRWRRLSDPDAVEVRCQCGEKHLLERHAHVAAACGRHFVWDGHDVHVAGLKS